MKQSLDVRGKACPLPVVEATKILATLQEGDSLEVAVDNFIAVQNLGKMAEQKHYLVSTEKIDENNYSVTLTVTETSGKEITEQIECTPESQLGKTVVVLSSNKMGEGDEQLGHTLMKAFIYALTEQERLPDTILLYNQGVYLSVEGSDSLADLKLLESQGVEILSCGTCLNHYGLTEKLSVGSVTNMYDIVDKQMQATKIIKP
ncbi:MAG: sulfurtransferase-like selenium metabolism protein YedF [Desulfosporosinus sp.]|jgi:selenium metabolism protein YedF